jgi:hypothetical protein
MVEAHAHVALPLGIARIGGGELATDRKALLVSRERPRLVARRKPHLADRAEERAHVALPLGIARIGGGELATDRKALVTMNHVGRRRG